MPALREQDLAHLWEAGTLPAAALVTRAGTPLQIVYRGRPNAGAGPDFRDAIIALPDGRLLHGDVELHLRASDFRRHGHQRDPAYDHVILHLVYRADEGDLTDLHSGRRIAVVALEDWLASRSAEIQAMLEQPALWREPCQDAIERMGRADVEQTLWRLGERRLRGKAAAARGVAPAAALYDRLIRTLGQGPQLPAWIELPRRVPATLITTITAAEPGPDGRTIESLLLGAAGLLHDPDSVADPGAGRQYLVDAAMVWRRHAAPRAWPLSTAGPRRPANHPARRLAGLARLMAGGPEPLLSRLEEVLENGRRPEQAMIALFNVPADGAWSERALPWGPLAATPMPALIGQGKALELVLNAALPVILAQAEQQGRHHLEEAALRVFHALPAPQEYGRTRHLARALRRGSASLLSHADASQAALHLHAYYCTRGGCGRCPLS